MNEQIQKLAKQAGAHWNHGDFNMGSSVEFQESDLEKFAELIVRECMSVAGKAASLDAEYEAWYLIKQHFGVE